MSPPTRMVVVWCPDWPIVAAGIDGGMVSAAIVFANRVVACSAAARREGVKRGLRRREAQARCPELVILERDESTDARAFEPVIVALEEICPRIEIIRPGVCAFAARGPSRYFGGDEAVRRLVMKTAGVPCNVGVADGQFAARLAARASDDAHVSTAGRVVPPGAEATSVFLAPFPVASLDRPELADLLVRLGVRTLGQFAALPAPQVLGRFGPDGEAAHRLAQGRDDRPLVARVVPPDCTKAAEIDPPAERAEQAAFVAKALADELHDDLRHRALACTRIVIEAETEHGEHLARVWRHDGALTAQAIAERVRWQLDGWLQGSAAERPTSGITLVRLSPDEVKADTGRQDGFWGGATQADERAGRALARVQGMLGPDAAGTAVIVGARGRPTASSSFRGAILEWLIQRGASQNVKSPRGRGRCRHPRRRSFTGRKSGPNLSIATAGRSRSPAAACSDAIRCGCQSTARLGATLLVGPDRGRSTSVGGIRRSIVVARMQAVMADGSAHLLAVEGGRWWVEATYD